MSWFQREPVVSLRMISRSGVKPSEPILDVGTGAAGLAPALVRRGYPHVIGLDLSAAALAAAKASLGPAAARATWLEADARDLALADPVAVWHDRAVFHFLVDAADRARYADAVRRNVRPGGHVVLAAFAPDGPETCSGLPVARYDAAGLAGVLGKGFERVHAEKEIHETPWKTSQAFTWVLMKRM